jgi:Leucine-rich repeat (LRR) protein
LEHNKLKSFNGIQGKHNLYRITAGDNKITDLSALEELQNIESLDLYKNQIVDLSPLLALKGLKNINLADNRVKDITPLYEISEEGTFQEKYMGAEYDINLTGNPLSKSSKETINKMRDMGIRISY